MAGEAGALTGGGHSPSNRWAIAATLAFIGAVSPLPVPLAGLHKFYLGQPLWGGLYLLLGWTPIPRVACAVEGFWYMARSRSPSSPEVVAQAPSAAVPVAQAGVAVAQQTQALAAALREVERLRQEGLISEQEFERTRRGLLDQLS